MKYVSFVAEKPSISANLVLSCSVISVEYAPKGMDSSK